MGALDALNPLKVAKRRSSNNYSALPFHESSRARDSIDSEKQNIIDHDYEVSSDDYDSSLPISPVTSSSRETSGSYDSTQPMIKRRTILRTRQRCFAYRVPQRIIRYLCFLIMLGVLAFIGFLIAMSIIDSKKLEDMGNQRPEGAKQWESFPFSDRYYGGIKALVSLAKNKPEYPRDPEDETELLNITEVMSSKLGIPSSKPYNPYPDYNSSAYLQEYVPVKECFLDAKTNARIPPLRYYEGRPAGFADHIMGSYDMMGLPDDICFDRYGRLGPYGHGYSLRKGGLASGMHGDMDGADQVWSEVPQYDFTNVDWAEAQLRCSISNAKRFRSGAGGVTRNNKRAEPAANVIAPVTTTASADSTSATATQPHGIGAKLVHRTAVVIRTWDEFIYREEDILWLRGLITELSLGSGGEYDIHLLVQVKDESIPVFADEETYTKHLKERVPAEFQGIATLWSETQMVMLYNGMEETNFRNLPIHGVYRGLIQALQWFAQKHPEYDFFWQWEMDVRYTGHWYNLFQKMDTWTKAQPRKFLWERNSRFYIPAVHGSWEDFSHMVRVQTESGTDSPGNIWSGLNADGQSVNNGPKGDKPIWGPERPQHAEDWFETENDPIPPRLFKDDKYEWGVGEDADLITLNPLFDPDYTTWLLAEDVTGYNRTNGLPPRRASIVTASRLSRRLLNTMHRETAIKKHHAFPEMWPAQAALNHGYKAVYAPHPMFVDRVWPLPYLGATMNSGRNGATGASKMGIFGEREHNLLGMTWYYNSGFAGNLWRRWMGLKVDELGGEKMEVGERSEGRMCVPPVLLHPIKGVELPVEEVRVDKGGGDAMGPGA
ncbi:hypothetical protein V501_05245 [Pseudogymnoascus sp. VKM F-4519 (FW-2642)]|nr:hypothetical protein V501_05245 [Pseudogymnoascus sp. VKM F-4519 (FW-2642)]